MHDGVRLDMQILKHFVRAPTSNEFGDVDVDAGAQHGRGTTRAETAAGDLVGFDSKDAKRAAAASRRAWVTWTLYTFPWGVAKL